MSGPTTLDEALRAAVRDVIREELPALLEEVLKKHRVEQHNNEARPAVTEDKLLNVEEVAARLGMSKPTVRRWIQKGELTASYVGPRRLLRVRQTDVEAFLNSSRQKAPSAPPSDLDAEAATIVACARSRPRKNERAPRTRPGHPSHAGE
ncbi:helix-turn-helix domain-containing protein [Polyangium aurulentum]|uniref:helix-turn-helix domain-containing protein n=1 Tax=Polyangium aurulentum TaxID=2567896 RepID=UPI0010AEE8B4|nr:helix-turn-helix domain-containing protein [Polyangium aurulentum]